LNIQDDLSLMLFLVC